MAPDPSLSTLVIIYLTSSLLRNTPRAFKASFNSNKSILPDRSLSKSRNAFSISSFYSSVRYFIFFSVCFMTFFLFILPLGIFTYLYSTNSSFSFNDRYLKLGLSGPLGEGTRGRPFKCWPMFMLGSALFYSLVSSSSVPIDSWSICIGSFVSFYGGGLLADGLFCVLFDISIVVCWGNSSTLTEFRGKFRWVLGYWGGTLT